MTTPSARAATAIALAYLPLAWFAACALRGKGLAAFGVALVALAGALRRFAAGRRQPLYRIFFIAVLAATTVGSLELVLRVAPGVLRGWYANLVLNGYHAEGDGIYAPDDHLGRRLEPGVQRAIYWNGYWWRHDANPDGYRGPIAAPGGAVFLGDSMVYGHGVETDETLPARFERATGLSTANLGQQGTCLIQALILLRSKGLALAPRYVFVCSHPTDLDDPFAIYPSEELRRFAAEDDYAPLARAELRGVARNPFDWWLKHASAPLRAGRLLSALVTPPRADVLERIRPDAGSGPFIPTAAAVAAPFRPAAPDATADERFGWALHERALAEIARLCAARRIRLVSFDLGYPAAFSSAVEDASRRLGIAYSPAGREILQRAQRGEPMYLPHDGHWSPVGCDAMARALARAIPGPAAP